MSVAQNPLTGQMKNSMGNFTTTTLNGQNIVRSKTFNRKSTNTELQMLHRMKFKLVSDEYKSLGGIVELGFTSLSKKETARNAFMAYNIVKAIDSSGDEPKLNYSAMRIAYGGLLGAFPKQAQVVATGVNISYTAQGDMPGTVGTDLVTAVMKTTDGVVYMAEVPRGDTKEGTLLIPYAGVKKTDIVYLFLFVRSADKKRSSESVYVPVE